MAALRDGGKGRSVVSERGGRERRDEPEQPDNSQHAQLDLHPLREDENAILRSEDVVKDGSVAEVVDVELLETEAGEAVDAKDLRRTRRRRKVSLTER